MESCAHGYFICEFHIKLPFVFDLLFIAELCFDLQSIDIFRCFQYAIASFHCCIL